MYSSCGRRVQGTKHYFFRYIQILSSLLRISFLGDLIWVLVDNNFEIIALQIGGIKKKVRL